MIISIAWMKKVEAAKWEAQRPADKAEFRHSDRMSEAEKERYQRIKLLNRLEMELQQMEASVLYQKEQLSNFSDIINELKNKTMTNIE
jgi:hypothetical protein